MITLKKIADNRMPSSLAVKLRRKRFELFKRLVFAIPKPLRILDVGGTEVFWEMMGFAEESDVVIILFNRSNIPVSYANFACIVGDARDMRRFREDEYNVVFSNSLIEHVGD